MDFDSSMYFSTQDIEKSTNPLDNSSFKSRSKLSSIKGFLRIKSDPIIAEDSQLPPTPNTPSGCGRRSWRIWKLKSTDDSRDTIISVKQDHQRLLSLNDEEQSTKSTHLDLSTKPDGLPSLSLPSPMELPFTPVTPSNCMELDQTNRFLDDSAFTKSINMGTTSSLSNQTPLSFTNKHVPLMQAHQTVIRSSIDESRNPTVRFADSSNIERKSILRRNSNATTTTTGNSNNKKSAARTNSHPLGFDYSVMPGMSIIPSSISHYLVEPMDVKTKTNKLTKKKEEFFKLLKDTNKPSRCPYLHGLNFVDSKYSPRNLLIPREDFKRRQPDLDNNHDSEEKVVANSPSHEKPVRHVTFADMNDNDHHRSTWKETDITKAKLHSPMPRNKLLRISAPSVPRNSNAAIAITTAAFASDTLMADQSISSPSTDDSKCDQPMVPVYSMGDSDSIQLDDSYLELDNEQTMNVSSSTMLFLDSYIPISDNPCSSTPCDPVLDLSNINNDDADVGVIDDSIVDASPTLFIMKCYNYSTSQISVDSLSLDSVEF